MANHSKSTNTDDRPIKSLDIHVPADGEPSSPIPRKPRPAPHSNGHSNGHANSTEHDGSSQTNGSGPKKRHRDNDLVEDTENKGKKPKTSPGPKDNITVIEDNDDGAILIDD